MIADKINATEMLELAVTHFELMINEDQWEPAYVERGHRMSKQLIERDRIVLILGIDGLIYTGYDALTRMPGREWRVYLIDPNLISGKPDSSDVARWSEKYPTQCEPIGIMCKGRVSDWVEDNELIMYGLSCATRVARDLWVNGYEPAAMNSSLNMSMSAAYRQLNNLRERNEDMYRGTGDHQFADTADSYERCIERLEALYLEWQPS